MVKPAAIIERVTLEVFFSSAIKDSINVGLTLVGYVALLLNSIVSAIEDMFLITTLHFIYGRTISHKLIHGRGLNVFIIIFDVAFFSLQLLHVYAKRSIDSMAYLLFMII